MAPKLAKVAVVAKSSRTPNQKSKKLQIFLAYSAVSSIHASLTVYTIEGKKTAAFDAYCQMIPKFFKAFIFPYNDTDFQDVFPAKEFSPEQLLLSTASKSLTSRQTTHKRRSVSSLSR
jgi:hypothetical protein